MKVGLLKTFLVLSQELNYHRTAKVLGLSQSAVSRQVAQLEHELGSELIDRRQRQIHLTVAGKVLARKAKQLITQLDGMIAQVKDTA